MKQIGKSSYAHSEAVTCVKLFNNLLISSSEDCSVKIWDITKLNHYLTNVNEFYRSNCIKTLTGHQGIIISTLVFYDPLKNINYIVSLGYMDLIKVWDLEKGQLIKDIKDIK